MIDSTGFAQQIACGNLDIEPANLLAFDCVANAPPIAVQGVSYSHQFSVTGGTDPYTWQATGLPDMLTLDQNGLLSGVPTDNIDTYSITVSVTDSSDPTQTATCDMSLEIRPGLSVNPPAMSAKGDCLDVGTPTDIDTLLNDNVVIGGDGTPITCSFEAFEPPSIGYRGHGNFPPGITVDDRCVSTGNVPSSEPLGVYAFIMTLTQEGSGQKVYLPFCATQEVEHAGAYDIAVLYNNADWGFEPGVTQMSPAGDVSIGGANDPQVRVIENCSNNSCFYKYYFGYNALNGGVSGEPSSSVPGPMNSVDGMTHSISVNDNLAGTGLEGRYWVTNVRWDYCLFGSDAPNASDLNDATCGTKELAQANGQDSNLTWSLVVTPSN